MLNLRLVSLGMYNALGSNLDVIKSRLFKGDVSGMRENDQILLNNKSTFLGECLDHEDIKIEEDFLEFDSRTNKIALKSLASISSEILELKKKYDLKRIGVFVGSSTSGVDKAEKGYFEHKRASRFPSDYQYQQQELGNPAEFIAHYFGLAGPTYTISTACSSSAKVFGSALRLFNLGLIDAAIVGGVDAICKLTLRGFDSLELVSNSRTNPFSKNRSGLNIGEGAAFFVLIKDNGGIQLAGVGESSDAYHISTPHPEGIGAITALRECLKMSDKQFSDVSYINLHGTGTRFNDSSESFSVDKLFNVVNPKVSSTKPLTGHLLGAAGATEIGFCWLALSQNEDEILLPPHIWDKVIDPEIPNLNFVTEGDSVRVNQDKIFISNSFAFGGSNCAVALRRMEQC